MKGLLLNREHEIANKSYLLYYISSFSLFVDAVATILPYMGAHTGGKLNTYIYNIIIVYCRHTHTYSSSMLSC